MSTTRIATQLAVDPALVQDANYKFTPADRRYIDDQIRAIEQLLVDNLINGKHASWFDLSGGSDSVIAGDTVCLSANGLVTKAVEADLVDVSSVLGIVLRAASGGGKVLVSVGGVLPPSITGLDAASGYVRVNTSSSRCEKVDSLTEDDFGLGVCDATGWMQIIPGLSISATDGGGGFGGGDFDPPAGSGLVTTTSGALDDTARAVASGFYTFVATPSGANLAALLTSALPASKGGTGLTSPGTTGYVLTSTGTGWEAAAAPGADGLGDLTELGSSTGLEYTDIFPVVDDPGGTPENQTATILQIKKAILPGYYSPEEYGAVGDGVTDDGAAFTAMFEDIKSTQPKSAATVLLNACTYYFADNLIVGQNVELRGIAGTSTVDQVPTRFKFAPGKLLWIRGELFNDGLEDFAGSSIVRSVAVECQPIPGVTDVLPATAYDVGDLVYLPMDRNTLHECIVAGTTAARPFPMWEAGTPYAEDDRVTAVIWDGHVYRATVAGTSDATEPEQWSFLPGGLTTDNDIIWEEDDENNTPDYWATWEMRPGVDANDPTVFWTASRAYDSNSLVRIAGEYDQVFYTQYGGTSGLTPPTTGVDDSEVVDGTITWKRTNSAAYLKTSGDSVWMTRSHSGIHITVQTILEDVYVTGSTNYAVFFHADSDMRPLYNANFPQVNRLAGSGNGFLRIRGRDVNGGTFIGVVSNGLYNGGRIPEWDKGIVDHSQGGNLFIGCAGENTGGAPFESADTAHATFVGCYSEAYTPSHIIGGVVLGGTLSAFNADKISKDSKATFITGEKTVNLICQDTSVTPSIYFYGAGQVSGGVHKEIGGKTVFGFSAGTVSKPTGLAYSDYLGGWPSGWYSWVEGPTTWNDLFCSTAFSADNATAVRDLTYGGGVHLIYQPGFLIGGRPDVANYIAWRTDLPIDGAWLAGDTIYKTPPANGILGWVCTVAGDYDATPPEWAPFHYDAPALTIPALEIDWAKATIFTKTLSAGANVFTFANETSGQLIIVRVTGAASTLTWPTVKWAGGVIPTQTASGTDVYTLFHDGTDIYGTAVQDMS